MKHLIIALVLTLTASFSMACNNAPGALTGNSGAFTKKAATSMTYSQVSNATIGNKAKQLK